MQNMIDKRMDHYFFKKKYKINDDDSIEDAIKNKTNMSQAAKNSLLLRYSTAKRKLQVFIYQMAKVNNKNINLHTKA